MLLTRTYIILMLFFILAGCTAATPRAGVYHTVKQGQTLYTISKVYDVDENYLARINGISDPTKLRTGQRVYIPGASTAMSVPVTVKPQPAPVVKKKVDTPRKKTAVRKKTVKKETALSKPVESTSRAAKKPTPPDSNGRFIWPVKGQIVKKFGNDSNKGLEIAVNDGTPVSSAAAGKVIYSGSGITGYGNLVIVRHDDSFFTVYGFNKRNLVNAGAFVSKGEKIALSGRPPSGGRNRVYFEIRYGKKPVNPLTYLP